MSHLTEQFFAETGDKAMYRMKSSDYHTLRYVKWLEAKVEKLTALNKQSMPSQTCLVCGKTDTNYIAEGVCRHCRR